MIKKIFAVSFTVIAGLSALIDGYLLFFKSPDTSNQTNHVSQEAKAKSTNTISSSAQDSSSVDSSSSASTQTSGLKDGTYTGASTSTEWGDVQLQIKVSGGKMTAITVLAHPDSQGHSIAINEQALPIYKKEALAAQSSAIDQISGATETYKGFTGSLQDAINQATTGVLNG
ncbi:FMN-binding protein [Streptococcus uberis]|uniref:FMN-binding protein n=1 Tax=Streptococcus uberis TaxID=1349 RepID=UPI00214F8F2E|nr:FMN-binding protein [Streptococcus uberis]MCR4257168.1 FMN-binding protein [Streptococcus uberis]